MTWHRICWASTNHTASSHQHVWHDIDSQHTIVIGLAHCVSEWMLFNTHWAMPWHTLSYVMAYILMRWRCMICTSSTDSMSCHTCWWDDAVWFVLAQQILCHVIHVDEMMLYCWASTNHTASSHQHVWHDIESVELVQIIQHHLINMYDMT
jgi:uncharacterized Zn-finger protein